MHELDAPIRGRDLGAIETGLFELRDQLEEKYGKPVYFPFFQYRPGEVRAQQGYLVKFPVELFDLLPALAVVRSEADADVESKVFEDTQPRRKQVPRGRLTRVQDPILRAAIEQHAVAEAIKYYVELGGTDFVKLGKPFDIKFTLAGEERHVEVKGSSLLIETVELAINEVMHATDFQPTDLVVVDDIKWERASDGTVTTSGGRVRVWPDWTPLDDDLAARRFAYFLPRAEPV